MRQIALILALLFFLLGAITAQSPYQLDWKLDGISAGVGVSFFAAGSMMRSKVNPLPEETLLAMDRNSVVFFDRPATFNNSGNARTNSDKLLSASYLFPLALAAGRETRRDFGKIALMYGEVLFLTEGLTRLVKSSILRPRPFVFNENFDLGSKAGPDARLSFFSGHTSNAAANCFFAAKVFSDFYPDSRWKPVVWSVAAVVPALTGYCRVAAGKHYPSDVVIGYGIGAAIGVLIPQLHKNLARETRLSFTPGLGGGQLVLQF